MNCRYRGQHLLLMDINKCGVVKCELYKYTLRSRKRMYRSAERPAIQSAYTGAFGGLLWYSQGAGGVDISPLKAPLPAYHGIVFLLKIIHLRTSIAFVALQAVTFEMSLCRDKSSLSSKRAHFHLAAHDKNFFEDERSRTGLDAPHEADRQWNSSGTNLTFPRRPKVALGPLSI